MQKQPLKRIPLQGTKGDGFFVRQLDDYSCGPACLATIANIYKAGGTYDDWRAKAEPDPVIGTTERRMESLSRTYLPCEDAGEGTYAGGVSIACIMQGGEGHYVVMLAREDDRVVYYDPYEHELVVDNIDNIEWESQFRSLKRWSVNYTPLPTNSIQRWLDLAEPKDAAPPAAPRRRQDPPPAGPRLI